MAQQTIQDASMQYAGNGDSNVTRINDNFDELYGAEKVFLVREVGVTPGGTANTRIPCPRAFYIEQALFSATSDAVTAGTVTADVKKAVFSALSAPLDLELLDHDSVAGTLAATINPAATQTVTAGSYIDIVVVSDNADLTGLDGLVVTIVGRLIAGD